MFIEQQYKNIRYDPEGISYDKKEKIDLAQKDIFDYT